MSERTSKEERDAFRQHVDEWGEINADDTLRLLDEADRLEEVEEGIKQVIGEGSIRLYLTEVVGTIRCQVTKNPCGTDTWMVGRPCACEHCTAYLTLRKLVFPDDKRF